MFERPETELDTAVLAHHLRQDISAQSFTSLVTATYLVALAARDRKLTREYFDEVLVTTFNFHNRLVRIAELNTMLENLDAGKGFSTSELKDEVERHMEIALRHQAKLLLTLKLFEEMRSPEDPIS